MVFNIDNKSLFKGSVWVIFLNVYVKNPHSKHIKYSMSSAPDSYNAFCFDSSMKRTVEETPPMRMGSMRVVVVFSSFFSFFSGGPGGLSPPVGRLTPPAPDMLPYKIQLHIILKLLLYHV